jgi:hypothetical protein
MQMRRLTVVVLVVCTLGQLQAAPAAHGGLAATVSGHAISLSWSAPPGSILGYHLEAGSAPGLSNLASMVLGATPGFSTASVPAGTYYARSVHDQSAEQFEGLWRQVQFAVARQQLPRPFVNPEVAKTIDHAASRSVRILRSDRRGHGRDLPAKSRMSLEWPF